MKKVISGILTAGVVFSGMATQTASAEVNVPNSLFQPIVKTETTTVAKEQIGLNIDGIPIGGEAAPVLKNNNVLVAFRPIAEYMEAGLKYDAKTKKVTITHKKNKVVIAVGQKFGYVNGKKKELSEPVQAINGKVYVPLRFVSESLGADVKWNAKDKLVDITIYKLQSQVYYYKNANGELGKPITEKQATARSLSGIAEGRELVGSVIVKDVTDDSYQAITVHNANLTGNKGVMLLTQGDSDSKGNNLINGKYYVIVVNENGELEFEKEGKLTGFESQAELLKYSVVEFVKDAGYVDTPAE